MVISSLMTSTKRAELISCENLCSPYQWWFYNVFWFSSVGNDQNRWTKSRWEPDLLLLYKTGGECSFWSWRCVAPLSTTAMFGVDMLTLCLLVLSWLLGGIVRMVLYRLDRDLEIIWARTSTALLFPSWLDMKMSKSIQNHVSVAIRSFVYGTAHLTKRFAAIWDLLNVGTRWTYGRVVQNDIRLCWTLESNWTTLTEESAASRLDLFPVTGTYNLVKVRFKDRSRADHRSNFVVAGMKLIAFSVQSRKKLWVLVFVQASDIGAISGKKLDGLGFLNFFQLHTIPSLKLVKFVFPALTAFTNDIEEAIIDGFPITYLRLCVCLTSLTS
jgi:hypothetical protein